MDIKLMRMAGLQEALFGIGLSYGLTSGRDDAVFVTEELESRLIGVASKLCVKGGGEDKFLRQIVCWWDVRAPRYWWAEADTYKVGTVAQSESTMHTIMHHPLTNADFEAPVPYAVRNSLDRMWREYRDTGNPDLFYELKNALPEGFLQRRIWTLSLAGMKNIFHQRKNHRLPQWKRVCEAFVAATPEYLQGMYE